MADRYWVGGTGTWNTTSTTNWSASSGGASGASVPTAADSVFFDQAGTYTVTCTGALTCLDITVSAGTVTFATGTTPTFAISGSMSLVAGTVWSTGAAITFNATTTGKTVTTNGVTLSGAVVFNGVGGGWTLGSALTTASIFQVQTGTFDTSSVGNYAVTCTQFDISNTVTRTINLNASTVTCSLANALAFSAATITNLTFNAGTSQINLSGTSASGISSGGLTFYNVAFTNSTVSASRTITGVNTFNNLAITGPITAGVTTVTFNARQTINNTLSTTGTAGNRRVFFASATYGISQDLVVNSAPSLTDADFRGLYVRGTSAPISGTRIGNRGECRGITFSAPKTVYWNLAVGGSFTATAWALSSGGGVSNDNFPLPQDTATIVNTGLNVSAVVSIDGFFGFPSIDMSGRTNAMTFSVNATSTVHGNWTNGSGTTISGSSIVTFSGGGTQTITSAGKTFSGAITVDTYGGTVELADALDIGSQTLTVTNGTFNTAGYAVTAGIFSSANSNVRTITLGASTCSFTSVNFSTNTNLTINAGTSEINIRSTTGAFNVANGTFTFYNVSWPASANITTFSGSNLTFNNLTFPAPASAGVASLSIGVLSITINGTLTCAGASAVRRVFLASGTIGTQRTITAAAISATDCDFRDINLAGAASGASPTRAGDCGGNSGITFPAAKTVYWNLAGAQNWSATAWAPSSGGTPDINQFPLAQDTAVFDNTGSVTGTITINADWNIGTFDASARTSAMTLTTSTNSPVVYGDWKFGTGVTSSSTTGIIAFAKNGTQTITSNGVQFGCNVTVNHPSGTVQLADAISLNSARTLTLTAGTFDAVTYNVTTGLFSSASGTTTKMGTGTWTLSGTGTVWTGAGTNIASTSTIVLSDTSAAGRIFSGGGLYYNKLTIGGTTGTSTLTITGSNTFGEIASTKTVAHTITFPATQTTTVGKWAVTGTVGNVVTLNSSTPGTSWQFTIAGPATSGIDYLSVRDCLVPGTSPGEFYVGANSTNVSNNTGTIIFTATPAARTLYWVGGTGNWSSTTKWSTSSGGGSGAAIPTSLDAVVFDSLSNATAYTATIDAGVTLARCASFTMAGPASGNVTFAGSVGIAFHGNVSFAATGITRTYTGGMQWAGNSSYTFTTNGLSLASSFIDIGGIGATWTLGSALTTTSSVNILRGTFSTSASNYALTCTGLSSNNANIRSISLNGSTLTLSSNPVLFSSTSNLTFTAGTSTLSCSFSAPTFDGSEQTFNNVSFTSAAATSIAITGANTFNTLSFAGRTSVGITPVTFNANQTITTLTLNAGTASAYRTFLASNTIGTQRTLTVTTLTAGAADYDFRDIAITGGAAPIAPTRAGDGKGNSGITFPAAKTVYYRNTGSANWGTTGTGSWSATSGGSADATQFPLAQDTAVFPAATYPASGSTTTVNANYNIGTIDMSLRTANTMTLATGILTPQIYGNWVNGTGTTLTGTGAMTFAGRGSQTITSAGKTFTQQIAVSTPGGSVTLQDAFVSGTTSLYAFSLTAGTLDANGYNVTQTSSATFGAISSTGSTTRTIAVGAGTWITAAATGWNITGSSVTVTGTGTISLTSASAKTFAGGGISYSGITLNQGGAGTLTITGNNTFKDITNTYSATGATSIALGNTTQTLTNPWTATGAATRVLTVSGTSAASPGTLIFSGSGTAANVDYLNISNVRAYDLVNEWYAGTNSTNSGSLGWYFVAAGGTVYAVTITETGTGTDAITARVTLIGTISETGTGTDTVSGGLQYISSISEAGTGTDSISAAFVPSVNITETATGSDAESAILAAVALINETASGTDTETARYIARPVISETATGTDADSARMTARSSLSETATITDLPSAKVRFLTAIAEAATASDLISSIKGLFAYIVESASGTDAINAPGSTYNPRLNETATATDSITALAQFASRVVESATISDLVAALRIQLAAILETASGTDVVSPRYIARPVVAETATGTDADFARFVARTLIAESATGTDTDNAKILVNPSVSEAASGADTASTRNTTRPSVAETATALDADSAKATFRSQVAETASAQDIVRGFMVAAVSVSETATGTDQISALRALAAAVVETLTLYEGSLVPTNFNTPGSGSWTVPAGVTTAIVELWGGGGGGEEGSPSGDGNGGGGGAYAKKTLGVTPGASLSFTVGSGGAGQASFPFPVSPASPGTASTYSTVTAGGGLGAGAGGTASGGDINISGGAGVVTAGGTAGGPGGGTSDTAPGGGGSGGMYGGGFFNTPGNPGLSGRVRFSYFSGTPTASVIFRGILQEIATLTDFVNAPGSTYSAPVVELAVLQDLVRAAATFPVSVTEAATGTQTNSAAFIPYANITESATVTDAASALANFAARMAETATISDQTIVAPSVFNAITVATATALDNFNPAGSIYNAPVIETAVALDSIIGAFLWNLIDDAQSAGWVQIDTAQVGAWAQISNEQSAVWTTVNTSQVPTTNTSEESAWFGAATNGSVTLALGFNGYIARSTDGGQIWETYRLPYALQFVVWSNGFFYVSDANTYFASSTDGLNWTQLTNPTFSPIPTSVQPVLVICNSSIGLLVVAGSVSYMSYDGGFTWTEGSLSGLTRPASAIWDGSKFVLAGRLIYTSTDGLNWTTRLNIGGSQFDRVYRLAWSGTLFVAVFWDPLGLITNRSYTSPDGITWTNVTSTYGRAFVSVSYVNGRFVFVAASTSQSAYYTSTTGTTTPVLQGTIPSYRSQVYRGDFPLAYVGTTYVLPGNQLISNNKFFYTSTNLTTFSPAAYLIPWSLVGDNQSPNWQNISNS